jgi:xylulokinase
MLATSARYVLGIDVGLSGVRAAVMDADGEVVGTGRRLHRRSRFAAGVAEHDPAEWLEGAHEAASEALAAVDATEIAAVGIAALGPAPLLVDADLEPLCAAPLFSFDTRVARVDGRPEDETTPAALADHAHPRLLRTMQDRPGLRDRAAWALDATGFLVGRCIGAPVMDSITRVDHVWPGAEPVARLPDPVDPLAIAGTLDARGAAWLGLPAGVPVLAGTYDSYVDVAAAGVRGAGDAALVLGSTVIVAMAVDGPPSAPLDGLGVSAYPGEGTLVGGWTLNGGMVLDWAARAFGAEAAEAASALPPGAGGLLALPYLAGERTPVCDADARGAVVGITQHTTSAELYRSFVDAVAMTVRDHVSRLPGGGPERWRLTGGGAHDATWVQATADAVGAPLDIVAHAGEAVGPAFLALRALGSPVPRAVVRTVEPVAAATRRFDALYDEFRTLHPLLADTLHRLSMAERTAGDRP